MHEVDDADPTSAAPADALTGTSRSARLSRCRGPLTEGGAGATVGNQEYLWLVNLTPGRIKQLQR